MAAFRAFRSRTGTAGGLLQPKQDAPRKLAGVGITCDIRLAWSEMPSFRGHFPQWTMRLQECVA